MSDSRPDQAGGPVEYSKPGKRFGWYALSATTFLLTVGVAAAAVFLGVSTIQMRAQEKPEVVAAPLVEVEAILPSAEQGYEITRTFVGRLEPARRTDLGFELAGAVREILADEGDRVAKGDVIARLDTRSLKAERKRQIASRQATESDLELAKLTFDRRRSLRDAGHVSAEVLDQARLALSRLEAALAQTNATIEAIDINLDKSVLTAPFEGQIAERLLDEGAIVAPGAPVLRILESARPTVRIGLAPEIVDKLDPEKRYDITLSGRQFHASLAGLRPDLETRTRTVETLFELEQSDAVPSFGRLAELSLTERVEAQGFWIPISALSEGPRGLWTVLTLVRAGATENISLVAREAVEVLHANEDMAFVRGTLRENTPIVAGGIHRVVPGQSVRLAGNGA
ncbi:RND family efflux transporter MFP subunit [Roseibium hamelinense]|uniref:RND family efflux transporter MFP subunit n=1 Tax=Roseibium hamelinense TaxID=150831 RepID=A0A562SIY3_9HYPH|nr:efflux RND transporter periplasmic adaptor subunit [Roseibium hamelinense]MTI43969.1 efflux RND transporter periplasmic adaptor subunit [Roseibium hamelinense]TWI80736.1 RND family efflux transporter MFP subunit [Roseibium hamelinense]